MGQQQKLTNFSRTTDSIFKMKIFCLLLLIAVAMEKCNGNYLLVEVDEGKGKVDVKPKDPKACCKEQNVPEFCMGLCMTQDEVGARSVRARRLNACSEHQSVIEKCFQDGLPRVPQAHCGWDDWCG